MIEKDGKKVKQNARFISDWSLMNSINIESVKYKPKNQ